MIILTYIMVSVMILTPFIIGTYIQKDSLIHSYIYGHLILWALFQVTAVPIIHLRLSFQTLFFIYLGVVGILTVTALPQIPKLWKSIRKLNIDVVLVFAIALIIIQVGIYIFGQHLDEDDARWIAEANDALTKNMMYLHNPATGEYIGTFRGEMVKDVFSPWSMYLAIMSKFTGIRPVILAHTIYAPILLIISYMIYSRIGELLFQGNIEKHLFLLAISVINLFFSGNPYTQAVFSLTRIWQGKAVVAAVIIPLIYMLYLEITEEDLWKNWVCLALCDVAACIFSGMGISISLIMIVILGGYAVVCGRWKRVGFLLLACLPSLVYGYAYYVMKG